MFYRDLTRAAPSAQPEVDLSMADGSALDALTVYLMRYERFREQTSSETATTQGRVRSRGESSPQQRVTCQLLTWSESPTR
jgi:hypothetical protein